jgi:uncharacterized protein (TIGR02284 family)
MAFTLFEPNQGIRMTTDNTIDVLNDLIKISKDGEYGFRASAEHAKAADLRALFARRADECGAAAQQLQIHVTRLGGEADTGGSATGALHRGWVAVRATLSSYTDQAILDECERGEDAALEQYDDALKEDLPADIQTVVAQQREGVKRNHDQIKALRNQLEAAV